MALKHSGFGAPARDSRWGAYVFCNKQYYSLPFLPCPRLKGALCYLCRLSGLTSMLAHALICASGKHPQKRQQQSDNNDMTSRLLATR